MDIKEEASGITIKALSWSILLALLTACIVFGLRTGASDQKLSNMETRLTNLETNTIIWQGLVTKTANLELMFGQIRQESLEQNQAKRDQEDRIRDLEQETSGNAQMFVTLSKALERIENRQDATQQVLNLMQENKVKAAKEEANTR